MFLYVFLQILELEAWRIILSFVNYRMKDVVATSSEFLIFLKTLPPVDPDAISILHKLPCCMMQKTKK